MAVTFDPSTIGYSWWEKDVPEGRRFASAVPAVSALRAMQMTRISKGWMYEATYEQQNMFSGGDAGGAFYPGVSNWGGWGAGAEIQLLTFNAMQIGFDTLCSKLEQANGRVVFQTDDGDWLDQQKAKQLEKLVAGEFDRLKFYAIKAMVTLDMLLHGSGYIKFYHDLTTKRPCMERWHPLDILYDEVEARDCPPLTMYTTRIVSKQVLKTQFPHLAAEIDRAVLTDTYYNMTTRGLNIADSCEVIEAWRLPTAEGAGDGCHLMCVSSCDLYSEEWTRMDFPFARFDWVKKRRGPYSIPAAEQVIYLQRNLNRLIQRQHECIYYLSAPYILTDEASQVNPAHFESDGVGNFIQFVGPNPPQVVVNKVVPEDIRVAIQEQAERIFAILGINGLESLGDKPAGLDSAPAMAQYADQSSLRHLKTIKENERFIIQCAEKLLELIRDIRDEYGEYKAFGMAEQKVEKIKFSDADLPPDAYVAQMRMANLLTDTPAGRIQQVQQLADTGAFTPKQIINLLRSPDIDAATSDVTSAEQDIDWTIYELSKPNGKQLYPEETQDLELGVQKVTNAFLKAKRQNAPDEVLTRLATWADNARSILQQQQQALMQQQMQMMQAQQQSQMSAQAQMENVKAHAKAQGNIEEMKAEKALDIMEKANKPPKANKPKKPTSEE